jgi:hypothetical protein
MQHSRVREIFDKEHDTTLEITELCCVGGKNSIEVNIQNIIYLQIYNLWRFHPGQIDTIKEKSLMIYVNRKNFTNQKKGNYQQIVSDHSELKII